MKINQFVDTRYSLIFQIMCRYLGWTCLHLCAES